MEPQDERRKFVRLDRLVDIVYRKHQTLEKEKLTLSRNISIGGICLVVYEKLKESQLLELDLCIPEEKIPIKALGKVVWVHEYIIGNVSKDRRYDVGIEFIEISDEDVNKVNKYVFSHL